MRKTVCLFTLFLLFSLSFGAIDTLKYSKQYGLGWAVEGSFTSDGQEIALASADGGIRLYDMQLNKTREFASETGLFNGMAKWLTNGSFVTVSDEYIYFWEADKGAPVNKVKAHSNWIPQFQVSSDNSQIMTMSQELNSGISPTVKLWDVKTGGLVASKSFEHLEISCAMSPLMTHILLRGEPNPDTAFSYWGHLVSFPSGDTLMDIEDYQSGLFSPDGSHFAVQGEKGDVRLWIIGSETSHATLVGGGGTLSHFSGDNTMIYSAMGGVDSVWLFKNDVESGALVHSSAVESGFRPINVFASPTGSHIFATSFEGYTSLFDMVAKKATKFEGYTPISNCAVVSKAHSLSIMGGGDGSIQLYDLESAELKHTLRGHQGNVRSLQLTANETQLLSSGDSVAILWDLVTKSPLNSWKMNGFAYNASVTPDGTKIVLTYAGVDSTIIDVKYTSADVTMHSFRIPRAYSMWLKTPVKLSSDGARIGAVGGQCVYIWDLESGEKVATYTADSLDTPVDFAFSADGKKIAVCGNQFVSSNEKYTTTAYVWSVETQTVEQSFKDIKYDMLSIALSADDSKLLIGSWQEIVLYETKTGKAINRYLSQGRDVGFSSDGNLAYSTGTCFRLWDSEVTAIVHPEAKGSAMSQVRISRVDATGLQLFLPNAVEKGSIEIYQANGRQLISSELQAGRISFDRPLAAGLYLYQIKNGAQTAVSGRFQIR